MEELAGARQGGWLNVTPADAEPAPPTSVWGRISGRGPDVPRITWMAPQVKRAKVIPAQIGIEHPAGGKAIVQLSEAGHPLPTGWTRLQDHPMRGLVVVPSTETACDTALWWSLQAVEILTGWAAEGRWRAQVWPSEVR